MPIKIQTFGRYAVTFEVETLASAASWVDDIKARNDVSLIRVWLPSGVRTIAYEGGRWVGSL